MNEWRDIPMDLRPKGRWSTLRIILRGGLLWGMIYVGLAILLILRLVEAPLFAPRRPITPHVTQLVSRAFFPFLGLRRRVRGMPMTGPGAMVANHASWLDIFVLNADAPIYFVAKSEVHGWPAIGWLARATGTIFIARRGAEALVQKQLIQHRLHQGHMLLFFPEGTSTDSRRVLPFKSTLFAAFMDAENAGSLRIQPVSVVYHAPTGADPRFYAWWAGMSFSQHLKSVLAAPSHGMVEVTYHDPVAVADFADRKALARHCEAVISKDFAARLADDPGSGADAGKTIPQGSGV